MAQDKAAGGASVSGSQGTQIGDGGTQINHWAAKPPLDPASLGALNPHTAVARIRPMLHDDVVDLFARATPADVTEVLKAFLEVDESKVVSVLADINPRRLRELIAPLLKDQPWLESVPEAAVAVDRTAASRGWTPAPPAEHLKCLERARRTAFFARTYEQGRIYWSLLGGAYAVGGEMAKYHSVRQYGYPISDEARVDTSPTGTDGTRQEFEAGSIYSSAKGTFLVSPVLLEKYQAAGATASWLGFPVALAVTGKNSLTTQSFEGGAIHGDSRREAHLVRKPTLDCLQGLWFAVSAEKPTPPSPYGTTGTSQEFESDSGVRAIVYWYGKVRCLVSRRMLAYYLAHGATESWLGLPIGRAVESVLGADTILQRFEGGALYAKPGSEAFGVQKSTLDMITEAKPGLRQLGYPISDEFVSESKEASVQFFANGVVTSRDGKREIWLRP